MFIVLLENTRKVILSRDLEEYFLLYVCFLAIDIGDKDGRLSSRGVTFWTIQDGEQAVKKKRGNFFSI
jgi:hypothetical protein